MKSSDDMINCDEPHNDAQDQAREESNASVSNIDVEHGDVGSAGNPDGIGDIVTFAIKTVAIALSLIVILTCIIAIAFPLGSMRIFNKLGMKARAVDFGERYVMGRLKSNDATETDERGNYVALMRMSELSDDDMVEALYVCSNLSYDLMEESYGGGNNSLGEYYAERVEKYTRIYLSLNGLSALNDTKSEQNVSAMPIASMQPLVYNYGNSVRNMNYRARAYLGETDIIAYNSRSNDRGSMTDLMTQSNSFSGRQPENRDAVITLLDDFTDYITQLGEYLDVEFIRAGIENNVYAELYVKDYGDVPVVSELFIGSNYSNILNGTEFGLFINNVTGFTGVYNNLKRFSEYALMAAEFVPDNRTSNMLDEQLHQLYWLQALDKAAMRFWYLDLLLYYNRDKYSASSEAIGNVYPNEIFQSAKITVAGAYSQCLNEYLDRYQQS